MKILYIFGKELHQPYSETLQMPFFEILMLLDIFKDDIEKQNEQNKKQNDDMEAKMAQARSQYSPQNMQNNMPKMPSYSAPKMPDFKMPKI